MITHARHGAAVPVWIAVGALASPTSVLALPAGDVSGDRSTNIGAQPIPSQQPPATSPQSDPIVVVGERRPLDSIADETLGESDIASYGANSISDLVDEVVAERGWRAGEIIYLVDGKRVSGLGDIAGFPSETVAAVEIYPVGSAPEVGGKGNQWVVNIRLKAAARTGVARSAFGAATVGGLTELDGEASLTVITAPRRAHLSLLWRGNDALVESERDIVQTAGAPADLSQFRSLRPGGQQVELRGSYSDQLSPDITAFLTTRVIHRNATAFLGIGENGRRLDQINQVTTGDVSLQLSGQFEGWLVNFNANHGSTRSATRTGRWTGASDGELWPRPTQARTQRVASELSVSKAVFDLPAGPVNITVRGRLSRDTIEASGGDFNQSLRQIGGGLFIPIARSGVGRLGELNASVDFSLSDYSDVGSVSSAIYSLHWQPTNWLRLSGSMSQGRTPPGVELLAAPVLVTPGTRYLDPLTRQSVDLLAISGGNPALASQRSGESRLSVEIRPRTSIVSAISAEYRSTSAINVIASLPPANDVLIAAFPDRFVRNDLGRLIEVDTRPVNFARKSDGQLRYGFELTVLLGEAAAISFPPRLNLLFSHSIQLENEILVAPGLQPIDLLSRAAFGFGGSEQSRHEFDATLRYFERGLGARLVARHRSAGFIGLAEDDETRSLRFSPITTVDISFFAEGQRLVPWLDFAKGSRLTLSINNLTNARQTVRDNTGAVPLAYQPAYRDPTGRLVRIEFRKLL